MKFTKSLLLFFIIILTLSSCNLFKEKCNECPDFKKNILTRHDISDL